MSIKSTYTYYYSTILRDIWSTQVSRNHQRILAHFNSVVVWIVPSDLHLFDDVRFQYS